MSLSRQEQNRAFKKNIIYGSRLAEKWGVDPHELSYIILKQNLSVLDLPSRFNRYSKYDPNYYKIDSEKLLETILNAHEASGMKHFGYQKFIGLQTM